MDKEEFLSRLEGWIGKKLFMYPFTSHGPIDWLEWLPIITKEKWPFETAWDALAFFSYRASLYRYGSYEVQLLLNNLLYVPEDEFVAKMDKMLHFLDKRKLSESKQDSIEYVYYYLYDTNRGLVYYDYEARSIRLRYHSMLERTSLHLKQAGFE